MSVVNGMGVAERGNPFNDMLDVAQAQWQQLRTEITESVDAFKRDALDQVALVIPTRWEDLYGPAPYPSQAPLEETFTIAFSEAYTVDRVDGDSSKARAAASFNLTHAGADPLARLSALDGMSSFELKQEIRGLLTSSAATPGLGERLGGLVPGVDLTADESLDKLNPSQLKDVAHLLHTSAILGF